MILKLTLETEQNLSKIDESILFFTKKAYFYYSHAVKEKLFSNLQKKNTSYIIYFKNQIILSFEKKS